MKQLEENFKNEVLNDLKLNLNDVVERDTIGIFKGLIDTYNDFINNKELLDKIELDVNNTTNDYEADDDEDRDNFREGFYIDQIDRDFLRYYIRKLVKNLINLGKYDGDYWISEHEELNDKTNYGVIWDNYYDVDTCIRETMGDILEDNLNEYLGIDNN